MHLGSWPDTKSYKTVITDSYKGLKKDEEETKRVCLSGGLWSWAFLGMTSSHCHGADNVVGRPLTEGEKSGHYPNSAKRLYKLTSRLERRAHFFFQCTRNAYKNDLFTDKF